MGSVGVMSIGTGIVLFVIGAILTFAVNVDLGAGLNLDLIGYILMGAGAFLRWPPFEGFHAERIIPADGFYGNHFYVTDGLVAFDYHGYSLRDQLLAHHAKGWSKTYPGWGCRIDGVDFDLLDTADLNRHKMLGPDQYLHDPVARARSFIDRIDHGSASAKARAALVTV